MQTVYRAIKSGKIVRPDKCLVCAKKCKPEGHHNDYTKKLEVIWVCRQCHLDIHRQHKFKERSNSTLGREIDKVKTDKK
jgi:hypothetical protein